MKSKTIAACLIVFPLAVAAEPNRLLQEYEGGVIDASVATEAEIVDDLVALTPDNEALVWNDEKSRVLVVTLKSEGSFRNFIQGHDATSPSEDYVIWVTLAPKMQERCQVFLTDQPKADKTNLDLYLKQFLGLYPEWNYDMFVELWVPPESLFRPCVDPETHDTTCQLEFDDEVPEVAGIANYRTFYENLYFKSFRYPPGVPWTGLGYTYNWGGPSNGGTEQGASEFILSPGTPYSVARAVPTMEYCQPSP